MHKQTYLQTEFEKILGSRNVYFQPPTSVKMSYPCIRYSMNRIDKLNANDKFYWSINEYEVTVIDSDPLSTIAKDILVNFPSAKFDRQYVSENLYHSVITLYF